MFLDKLLEFGAMFICFMFKLAMRLVLSPFVLFEWLTKPKKNNDPWPNVPRPGERGGIR